MSIYEYDQEKHLRQEREDAWEDGLAEGERIKLKGIDTQKTCKREICIRDSRYP